MNYMYKIRSVTKFSFFRFTINGLSLFIYEFQVYAKKLIIFFCVNLRFNITKGRVSEFSLPLFGPQSQIGNSEVIVEMSASLRGYKKITNEYVYLQVTTGYHCN